MRETKRESQCGEKPGNMENPIILITSSEEEEEEEEEERAKKEKRSESEEVVTVRSLKEEYRMISDLSGFDNLRAMMESETFMRRKKRRRKKKKRTVESQAQEEVTVDAAEVKEGKDESVETVEALTTESVQLPENDVPQKLVVDAPEEREQVNTIKAEETTNTSGAGRDVPQKLVVDAPEEREQVNTIKAVGTTNTSGAGNDVPQKLVVSRTVTVDAPEEREQGNTIKAVETTNTSGAGNDVLQKLVVDAPEEREQANTIKSLETTNTLGAVNGVNSAEMIDLLSSPSEYNGGSSDMNFCRDVGQTLRTEVIMGGKNKRKKRRRKNIRMLVAAMTVNGANKQKQADTCDGVETMKTLETESAEMKDKIVLRQRPRKPRYFVLSDDSWSTCSKCGEEDHAAANCTMQKQKKPCSLCGSFEHIWKRCRQGQNCFVCKERGHLAIDCPEKPQENNLSSNFCLKCGDTGHDMFSCRSDYSTDDLKEIQCYVCKSFGHLCCVDLPDMGPRQDICYNCGQSDHLGSVTRCKVCTKSFGVIRYSKSYKFRQEGHFARTCTNKRAGDCSTSAQKLPNKMRNLMEPNSAPPVFCKAQQKEIFHIQENVIMNASQSK